MAKSSKNNTQVGYNQRFSGTGSSPSGGKARRGHTNKRHTART